MVIVINNAISGLSWVHLIWLDDVTVRFQPYTIIGENYDKAVDAPIKFEKIVVVAIDTL